MSLGTEESLVEVVLDTNILVSALAFGGNPEKILRQVLDKNLIAITSPALRTELIEVLLTKFNFSSSKIKVVEELIDKNFILIYPQQILNVVRDEDDNRVLEAAIEGGCNYIITGDKELLKLGIFRKIRIITSDQFLNVLDS